MTKPDARREVLSARELGFLSAETASEQLEFAARCALLAPSGHNTQPWLFRIQGDSLDLFADRTRALPVVDPEDRELVISCGAALFHLRLALGSYGIASRAQLLPDPGDADLLARVTVCGSSAPAGADLELFRAITNRRTNRSVFEPRPLPEDLMTALEEAALLEGAELFTASDRVIKSSIAELVAAGDRAQMADPSFRRELAAWVHHNRARSLDGMSGEQFGIGDLMSFMGPLVIRRFDMGESQAAKDVELAVGAPQLALIHTADDTVRAWLSAGRALARVLLRSTAAGVSASYLNQPVERPELRPRLAKITCGGHRFPQILLRMGFSDSIPAATPRRCLDDVLL